MNRVPQSEEVKISTEYIQLDQFLKWAGIVESGGHAKELIEDDMVSVNGSVVHERRKKLYPGDSVAVKTTGVWKVTAE